MKIGVHAVGRMKAGPERDLADDYLTRANGIGRGLALGPVSEREIDPRRLAGPEAETEALLAATADAERIVAMDERGRALPSRDFAGRLAEWRDAGARQTAFLIGGAEGLAPAARQRADLVLAFGPATWPHRLARVMLYEQLYRAFTILAGAAYHKE